MILNNLIKFFNNYKTQFFLLILTIISGYYFTFGYLLNADDISVQFRVINGLNIFSCAYQEAIACGRIGFIVNSPLGYLGAFLQTFYVFRILFIALWFLMLYLFSLWVEAVSEIKIAFLTYFLCVIFQVLCYNHMPPTSYPIFITIPFLILIYLRLTLLYYPKHIIIIYLLQIIIMLFEYNIIMGVSLVFIEISINLMKTKNYKCIFKYKYDLLSIFISVSLIFAWRFYYPTSYDGIQINNAFSLLDIIKTIIIYSFGGTVLFYNFNFYNIWTIPLLTFIILFIYLLLVFKLHQRIIFTLKNVGVRDNYYFKLFILFILVSFLCVLPTALTEKHQLWVSYGTKGYVISRVSYLFLMAGVSFLMLFLLNIKFFKFLLLIFIFLGASYSFIHNYFTALDMKDYCSAWDRASALSMFSDLPDTGMDISYLCDPKQRVSMHSNFDRNKYWIDYIRWKSKQMVVKIPLRLSHLLQLEANKQVFNEMDFSIENSLFIHGLSGPEPWGRWSDANIAPTVKFQFNETLPDIFTLFLRASAFGPNIGDTLTVHIADQTYSIQIPQENPFDIKINVDLKGQKTNKIEFIPPKPTSPKELGISEDDRKLGIGFISMKIIPVGDEMK